MMADKSLHLVPQLRFPEFQKAPAWFIEPLGYLFPERNETGFSELPLLSVTDREGVVPQEETNRKVTANANRAKYLRVVPGDIVYNTMRMWEGRSARVRMEGVVSPAYTVCRPRDEVNSYFFAYYFKTWSLIAQFRKYSQGLVKDTLSLKYVAFSLIPVGFPPSDEQQKIADCLGSLDDLIAAEDRKLDALRQHKQGLMQQLFPRPGETVPRLRFPEFQRAGDWKLDQIGNVASITKGKGVSKADIAKGGVIPCIRYAELYTHYREVIHEVVSRTNIPREDLMLSLAEDVIVPASGETRVDIARAACVLPERVALGSDLNILRSDLYGPFFSYLLNSPLRHTIARMAQGDTVAHLYPKQLTQVWLAYPVRLEQQKIADCLGSLDDLIAAEGRKLDALRQHKQGLMQQLFPPMDGR